MARVLQIFIATVVFGIVSAPSFAKAEESYLGLYLQGQRIGFISSSEEPTNLYGSPAKISRSKTVMDAGLLGAALVTTIDQTNWISATGRPILIKFTMSSAGRTQYVEANFSKTEVRIAMNNNGSRTTKVLPIPKDLPIVDDALNTLMAGNVKVGDFREFYVLDPMTATFVKNKATSKGRVEVKIGSETVKADSVEILDPRMAMTVFLDSKGNFLQASAMGGMELRPISKEEALAPSEPSGMVDLAEVTRIPVAGMSESPSNFSTIRYRFVGGDLSKIPSDVSQSATKEGANWIVTISPRLAAAKPSNLTISQAAAMVPQWIQPGLHVSSNDPKIKKLAYDVIGKTTSPIQAAKKIAKAVNTMMNPNAGIGVLRDATEILRTKEGVCRDYAILTATLLRSAKIPARLASGLVYSQDSFYYHAWVESWDGSGWYGIDSTRSDLSVTPGHIKLAQGSVEDAFLFTFLDHTKVEVLSTKKKPKGKEN